MTRHYFEAWLYGSQARGDHDGRSDLDILIVGDSVEEASSLPLSGTHLAVSSLYSWDEIASMAVYGSLFLWHLRLEGQPLVPSLDESRLRAILDRLPPYQRGLRDVRAFRMTLNDVSGAIRQGSSTLFEMSVLATVVRHASILGCYLKGQPTFGRTSAIRKAAQIAGFDASRAEDLSQLYLFRLHEDGRAPLPFRPSRQAVQTWTNEAQSFLKIVEGWAHEFYRLVP